MKREHKEKWVRVYNKSDSRKEAARKLYGRATKKNMGRMSVKVSYLRKQGFDLKYYLKQNAAKPEPKEVDNSENNELSEMNQVLAMAHQSTQRIYQAYLNQTAEATVATNRVQELEALLKAFLEGSLTINELREWLD